MFLLLFEDTAAIWVRFPRNSPDETCAVKAFTHRLGTSPNHLTIRI